MKISNKVTEPLGRLIAGDTGSAPYLSGPKLVGFYNECGFDDVYGEGFPSRWRYSTDKIIASDGTPRLKKILEDFIDPRRFNGDEKLVDTVASEINQLINVHNSALVVGETGSGKTELVRQYIRRLEQAFTPEQMKYVIYDLKVVEFDPKWGGGAKQEYSYTPVRTGKPEDMDYLEELALLAEKRATEKVSQPMIFIYIEECGLAAQYPGRFHDAVIKINANAKRANMKLIFSTSRPSPGIITPAFRDSFDLILSGTLASEEDEKTMGVLGATSLRPHEFIIKEL